MEIKIFPTINACLNALAGIFLFLGFLSIKKGDRKIHQKYMVAALISSTLFLISYVSYHISIKGVVTKYQGEGLSRIVYFLILMTHTPLAAIIVPFCISAVILAYQGKYDAHKKITRWLYPTWMYVSITGVLIYLMLYIF